MEEILESLASVTQRQLRERYTAQLEHVEDDKDCGSLQGYLTRGASGDRQALLQGSKICVARLVGDDDFAVQQRPRGHGAGRLYQFRKEGARSRRFRLSTWICHGWRFSSGRDIFRPDAERFAGKAQAAGTPTELHIYPDAFHVFAGVPLLPEAHDALSRAVR